MPAHLKALIVILVLAAGVFVFAKAPICASASTSGDFERRRNLWCAITITAFLAHNFWIYVIVSGVLLLYALQRESNKIAMFFFILFAVPVISANITGLGIVNYLFSIDYVRLLAMTVLFPAYLSLRTQSEVDRFGQLTSDKLIASYIILNLALVLGASTYTATLRQAFYSFTDIFLPYYVASRYLRNVQGFRDALAAYVVAALVISAIAVFESTRYWLLYTSLPYALGVTWAWGDYLQRESGGLLRASASVGHAISLGYVIAVAFGFFLFVSKSFSRPRVWWAWALLIVGLVVPMSRGPWVGAAAILLIFVATSPSGGMLLARLGLFGAVITAALLVSPLGDKIFDYLPFVGTAQQDTVLYRRRLLDLSVQVILQNPFFGAYDSINSPLFQELKLGNGFIDIVNSYVAVGLSSGLVGLSLFASFFVVIAINLFKAMRSLTVRDNEHYFLGQALFCVLIGILLMIFTVSSITVIPVVYWSVAGLCVACARTLTRANTPAKSPAAIESPSVSGRRPERRGAAANAESN